MDIEEDENLIENDKEFIQGLGNDNNINNDNLSENPPNIFNPPQFQTEILLNFFENKNILKKQVIYPKCKQQCTMVKDNQKLDNYIWRCRSRNPSHDTKINIRKNSILEYCRYRLKIIYFLLFYCFAEKKVLILPY